MEQAINLFSKGLQMDTHPMVLSSDTLTDALNATFVTMNGNEVVLQNDMGNRRVDNAFLPAGYEPVGIKEYGGIIYIAAYNPITNKSLIGSFPSPERKIGYNDDKEFGNELDFSKFSSNTNIYTNDKVIYYLKLDTMLLPLTKDTTLHAGDKFVVYGNINQENVSNVNNTDGEKIKSPKNKLYTLSIGVLNSQNEFVDITKTLNRWTQNGEIIKYSNPVSDLYKFNDGYFIPQEYTPPSASESYSDLELIQERLVLEANTYAYKLVGPLYLKVTLNHIKGFNYNIYGVKTSNTKCTLWIEGYITYNCPDGINDQSAGNSIYKSLEEGEPNPNLIGFDLFINNSKKTPSVTVGKSIYDTSTDLYSVKILCEYTNINIQTINYTIGVLSGLDGIYLEELSNSGIMNLNLLGSNTVELTEWRFFNNFSNKQSMLTYSFNAYPKYGLKFSDLTFIFIPYKKNESSWSFDNNAKQEISAEMYNGRITMIIDWDSSGLEPRTLYKVQWKYKSSESDDFIINTNIWRWFLTTELFNSRYNQTLTTGVKDYKNIKQPIKVECELLTENTVYNTNSTLKREGSIFKKNLGNINIVYTTEQDIRIDLDYKIKINYDLYPNFIQAKSSISNLLKIDSVTVKSDDIEVEMISGTTNMSANINSSNTKITYSSVSSPASNVIMGKLINKDAFVSGSYSPNDVYIKNGFISFIDNYITNYSTFFDKNVKLYSSVWPDYDENYGPDDDHYARIAFSSDAGAFNINYKNDMYTIAHSSYEDPVNFEWGSNWSIGSQVIDKLNTLNKDIPFTWGYSKTSGTRVYFTNNPTWASGDIHFNNNARVWWRTSLNGWALCFNLMPIILGSNYFKDYIKNFFKLTGNNDYKFAYYENISLSNAGLYKPDLNRARTKHYTLPATLSWKNSIINGGTEVLFEEASLTNGILNFELPDLNNNSNSHTFSVSTSEEFEELIGMINYDTYENVDIENGIMIDLNGNKLDGNKIYKSVNNQITNPYTEYDFIVESVGLGKRILLYNKDNMLDSPEYQYSVAGADSDSMTAIDFKGANIARL